jgi:2-C-methyl-D-erythritol 4-phosphate cytidylyltransferase/2-C-methyl-D-erythritol 2,4-cyclodiphosphate synthase
MAEVAAILAAAGRGIRFGASENKVFTLLAGRPLLAWSLLALERSPSVNAIVVAVNAGDERRVDDLASAAGIRKLQTVCAGGAERYDTVWNALEVLPPVAELVAVHDGARPLTSPALIEAVVQGAREGGAAVPAIPMVDTLKRSADGRATKETTDRAGLFGAQTPQVFRRDWLEEAYRSARSAGFAGTDDAAYVERLGHEVRLVPGERENLKITTPQDLAYAEALLRGRGTVRTGIGYDVHPLVAGRPLVLGGVALEHPVGLDGHSDADVLLHAICDALLGAACLGDIGVHFPNTDLRYREVSSVELLRSTSAMLDAAGFLVEHVDATLLAEAPRIRPHVEAMRANIAGALGISPAAVSIKATTSEGLGFVGRHEGMAAHAVATLRNAALLYPSPPR